MQHSWLAVLLPFASGDLVSDGKLAVGLGYKRNQAVSGLLSDLLP